METHISNIPQCRHGILRVKWTGTILQHELMERYNAVLNQALHSEQCRIWLLDVSEREWADTTFNQWMAHDFMMRATRTLAGPVFAAYLVAPHHLPVVQQLYDTVRTQAAEHNFYCSFFENAAQAYAWLRDQQGLQPTDAKDISQLFTAETAAQAA